MRKPAGPAYNPPSMYARLLMSGLLGLVVGATACSGEDAPPDPPKDECGYHDECPTGQVCYEGACYATASCVERRNCRTVPVCEGDKCFCNEDTNRCLPACVLDDDCPADGHCLDGVCERYPVDATGWMPATGDARGQLQVGLARVALDFPMGVSLAGYGSRLGPRTPYQDSLGGSHSWFDRPEVRAAAFDDGKELFVLLRTPTCWSTDFLLARTAEKVALRTGIDVRDRIVQSAPHSHAQPARYWHLVVGLGFGFFGYGEFSGEVFERMTDSFADAVELALADRQPARFGYTVLDDFDPENRIHRDRRGENDNLPGYLKKDDRMVVMRVDDLNGEPRAVFTNFGMHGTIFDFDSPVVTGDAGGGVEVELTHAASKKYGRPVLGFYIQGNAGDISPSGDDHQHNNYEQLQVVGRRAWAVIEPALDGIQTSAEVPVGLVTGRIPISHDILGYGEGAFYDSDVSCEATPDYFRYGAFQCVEGRPEDSDPATKFTDGDLNCVFSVECLTGGHPIPQFQKTVISVLRLGKLAFTTMPGEPLSNFGRDAAEMVQAVLPDVDDTAVIGYSQDHHFYLLNEDDWLQGGYEPSRDIWGWRLGPYLQENAVKLARELAKEPEARVIDNRNLKPMYWPLTDEELARVPFTASPDPSEIRVDVPETVERLGQVRFVWQGGHPGADLPRVSLEREEGGQFVPVARPGGWAYDDAGFEMMVTYQGSCNRSQCDDHQWQVRWQEGRDFPAGRYRLAVEGKAFDGAVVSDYTVTSRAFELVPSAHLVVEEVTASGGALAGVVLDPPQVALTPDGDGMKAEDDALVLRSEAVPSRLGAPLAAGTTVTASGRLVARGGAETPVTGSAQVTVADALRRRLVGTDASGSPRYEDERTRPTSRFSVTVPGLDALPAGDYWLELSLTDPDGNSGTFTATVTR
ncbi:MAG: hypothetical protein H6730_01220 [Deltaproteobacteria bacterium]|nr:hypothetical protein [Deltaproteobacteria bacterium]